MIIEGVSVEPNLSQPWRLNENVFDFLWGNILTLWELKDVLCSVNDLNWSVGEHFHDITTFQPSIFRWTLKCLCCLLRILIVPLHDRRTPEDTLTSWLCVLTRVTHFWNVLESDLHVWLWSTNMTGDGVGMQGRETTSRRLSHTIAFHNWTAEANLQEVEDVSRYWGRASEH